METQTLNFTTSINRLFASIGRDNLKWIHTVQKRLLMGIALSVDEVANLLNSNREEALASIELFGEKDEQGNIAGFFGLTLIPTNHSFKVVQGAQLYTWCATDALLFPSILELDMEIKSHDPVDNKLIELAINKNIFVSEFQSPVYISWIDTADCCDIRNTLCNKSFFFASKQTAKKWLDNNPDSQIYRVEELLNEFNNNVFNKI